MHTLRFAIPVAFAFLVAGSASSFAQTPCADAIRAADADQKLTSNVISPELSTHMAAARTALEKKDEVACMAAMKSARDAMAKK